MDKLFSFTIRLQCFSVRVWRAGRKGWHHHQHQLGRASRGQQPRTPAGLRQVSYSYQFYKGCGVAQRVRRSSVRMRSNSVVVRRLAVRQARIWFSARHHREVFPIFPLSWPAMRRWRGTSANCDGWMMNVMEWMYVLQKYQNKQKEWHHATIPLIIQSIYKEERK